jgi:uncharacterized membrane protein
MHYTCSCVFFCQGSAVDLCYLLLLVQAAAAAAAAAGNSQTETALRAQVADLQVRAAAIPVTYMVYLFYCVTSCVTHVGCFVPAVQRAAAAAWQVVRQNWLALTFQLFAGYRCCLLECGSCLLTCKSPSAAENAFVAAVTAATLCLQQVKLAEQADIAVEASARAEQLEEDLAGLRAEVAHVSSVILLLFCVIASQKDFVPSYECCNWVQLAGIFSLATPLRMQVPCN